MPAIDKILANDLLPKQADCVVIGAGIIGIATALELAERGMKVVVVEKGEVAAEQSSRNWGWCRQMGRDPREVPLIIESLKLWRDMNARIEAETGFRTCGIIYLAEDEPTLARYRAWQKASAEPHGIDTQFLTSADIERLLPGGKSRWIGGTYTTSDGRAEPFVAVPAMARALQRLGSRVFTQCAARGVETQGGKVVSVVTERGVLRTDKVVLAGGYWSSRFLGNLGIRFPQLGVLNSVMRTTTVDAGSQLTVAGGKFAMRKRLDGGYTVAHNHLSVADIRLANFKYLRDFLPILRLDWTGLRLRFGKAFVEDLKLGHKWDLDRTSPFEFIRVLDPAPVKRVIAEALADLKSAFPAFANARIAESWGGIIDATPDTVPVIDHIDAIPGLYLASGFSGHGFGLGPGAGKLMAQILTGEKPCVDPAPFRFKRFSDGSLMRPTTGV